MEKLAIHGGKPIRETLIPYGKQYIDDSDIEAVIEVLRSQYLTTGPKVSEFENKLCKITGARYAVALSNGTAALHAACYAAGIKKDDEVITTPITFAASANCILYCRAVPVFADINPYTWNIDPKEIERKINNKTKAVIVVDFTGQAAQLQEIKEICRKYKLILIEDAAHAIGTKYNGVPVGNISDLTTFSFHPVKTVTCGEGGAVVTNNESYYRLVKLFRSHGITREINEVIQHPFDGYYEQIELGYNYRISELQAALGVSQIDKLSIFSNRRNEIVKKYNDAFSKIPEITIQQDINETKTTRHLYIIRIKSNLLKVSRNEIYKAIYAENIGLQVHYIPVYYHPFYQRLGYCKGICPIAEKLYEEIITLPLYYSLTEEDVASVIKAVIKVIEYYKV